MDDDNDYYNPAILTRNCILLWTDLFEKEMLKMTIKLPAKLQMKIQITIINSVIVMIGLPNMDIEQNGAEQPI